jgi:formate hydrogenlyase subunit 6/NADH:ubiquinone oxidoreductase subunit I
MVTIRKLLRKQSLEKLYNFLAEKGRVYAPIVQPDKQVGYKYNPAFAEVTFDHIRSILSAKNVVFPKVENLITYINSKTESTIADIDSGKIHEVVLWGTHPCDNAAFDILSSIFCQDTEDKFFSERLSRLLVVGLSCHQSDEYCFCTSAGVSPSSGKGSDILLTLLKNGDYQADIITEKGFSVVSSKPELFESLNGGEVMVTEVKQKFIRENLIRKLPGLFENPFWVENSLRCIGCGACAYVCPTCACFDIQDETHGRNGLRYRCWDSCGFSLFTLHTSGHNPRHVQSQRWRQRIMHKFSYMPDKNGTVGCVGCGRCSAGCPVDMNIAEQLEALQKT